MTASEDRLKNLLVRGLDGDAAAYHRFLVELSARLRAFLRRRLTADEGLDLQHVAQWLELFGEALDLHPARRRDILQRRAKPLLAAAAEIGPVLGAEQVMDMEDGDAGDGQQLAKSVLPLAKPLLSADSR